MREKLKSLPLTELKQIAKENHIKNVSTLRKAQLIDVILERLSPEQAQAPQTQNVQTSDTASSDNELVSASSETNSTDTKTALSETDSSQMSSAQSSSDDVLLKNLLIQQHKESAAPMLLLQLPMLPQEIIFTAGIIPIPPLPLRIFASQTPTRFIRVSHVYETVALILTGVRIL